MPLSKFIRWFRPSRPSPYRRPRTVPQLQPLERREVPAGYLATGAGPGGTPWVAVRVDIRDAVGGAPPNNLAQPPLARGDGQTDVVSQIFFPFNLGHRGGVNVASGNFDGDYTTPDSLVTAAGPGGGPHVIIWNMKQNADGTIVTDGIRDQFMAYDVRFAGGVHVATGDLNGDGKAELIVGAGAGGGPHVRIFSDFNGRFRVVNEFFAFDPRFRGGVNVASGQGYNTVFQQRYVLDGKHPEDFQETLYTDIPDQKPGQLLGIPLSGRDFAISPGGIDFDTGYRVPAGVVGHEYEEDGAFPIGRPYFTVASGSMQYLSGNLLNSYGNISYGPNIFFDPSASNEDDIGRIVYASWAADKLPAGTDFQPEIPYGPFVRVGTTKVGDSEVAVITRFVQPPDQVTFRNQLIVGAGPGGGPHVKIYEFAGTAGGGLLNNGVGKEFFAFDASFNGGVTVAIGDVVANTTIVPNPNADNNPNTPDDEFLMPARIDFQELNNIGQRPLLFDRSENTGSQAFYDYPAPPDLGTRYQPEIVIGMASKGSQIRVFGDRNPARFDDFGGASVARRTSVAELDLRPIVIDSVPGIDPTLPFQGYSNTPGPNSQPPAYPLGFYSTELRRGVTNPTQNKGGVNVAVGALNFGAAARFVNDGLIVGNQIRQSFYLPEGLDIPAVTGETAFRGFNFPNYDPQLYTNDGKLVITGSPIPVNPVLGQLVVASSDLSGGANRGTRVRVFNELSPNNPVDIQTSPTAAWDNFEANRGDLNSVGGSVAFGFGVLPPPALEVTYSNYATTANGGANSNELNFASPPSVTDPILITLPTP